MKRFQGQPLPAEAKIAVIANDALGNYVVSTPLLQMLRAKYPSAALHYFSGKRVEEFWSRDPNIDFGYDVIRDASLRASFSDIGFDLIINIESGDVAREFAAVLGAGGGFVCGPAEGLPYPDDDRGDLWRDREWISADVVERFPFLPSPFIGDMFCRLAYLDGPIPLYQVPQEPAPFDVPDVLIATAASLPEKLWPVEKWIEAIRRFRAQGLSVGLIGAKPTVQKEFWQGGSGEEEIVASGLVEDLRGMLTLPQVVGALGKAKQVLTLDNGILHLAVAAGTPTTGLYRFGIHRLWAPPSKNLRVVTPGEGHDVAEIAVDEVVS